MLRRVAIAAIAAVLIAGTLGCTSGCGGAAGPTDAEMRSEIATNFDASNITGIQVSVVNGVATLTGSADQATADRAAEIARGAKGVQSVENKITVGAATTAVPPTVISPDQPDSMLAGAVNLRLAADPALAGSKIDVPKVVAGIVTLSGTVPSDSSKAAAEKTAMSVVGVKSVVNQLQVVQPTAPEAQVPDEQIKASVEQLLDEKFSELTVFVKVTNGVVELSGALPNRGLVVQITTEVRNQVKGVKNVDTSRFTIQGGESGDKKLGAPANKN